jgi:hypothetical protein
MTAEQNKLAVERFFTEANDGQRYAVLDELCHPDVIVHDPFSGEQRGCGWCYSGAGGLLAPDPLTGAPRAPALAGVKGMPVLERRDCPVWCLAAVPAAATRGVRLSGRGATTMTRHAHLKERIRARMRKTGERYAAARRHVLAQRGDPPAGPPADPFTRAHLPGNVPATTALRVLLHHAGIVAPHSGEPFGEALLFGIAGGIGIGIFSFYYQREDFATFFVGGRHHWYDDRRYLVEALERLGVTPVVQEAGGAKTAAAQLQAALAEHGPCVVWVDSSALPHRAAPGALSGAGYHVVTVYQVDGVRGRAVIGDLADDPITIPLDILAGARGQIKKDRHRLLSLGQVGTQSPLGEMVNAGLRACREGLLHPGLPGAGAANARLEALEVWAERMEGSRAKERWERVYRRGPNLFRGLCAINDFIEHYGTGGGLCRPLFAEFLGESAAALGRPGLGQLADRYAALGQAWSDLADAALPDDVPLLSEARELLASKAALRHGGGPVEELHAVWTRLAELERESGERFPLSEEDCRSLRGRLRDQIAALHAGEEAAHDALGRLLDEQQLDDAA